MISWVSMHQSWHFGSDSETSFHALCCNSVNIDLDFDS
jgi:hypothetical protein